MTEAVQSSPPGPGAWELETTHYNRPVTRFAQDAITNRLSCQDLARWDHEVKPAGEILQVLRGSSKISIGVAPKELAALAPTRKRFRN